jgi:radical SAM-linked protein
MTHESPIKQRLHISFGKFDALKYTGNLDIGSIWERVLRRADLPVLYTQGFNTRPRIKLASALPLGITSECELLDVALDEILGTVDGIKEQLEAVSPQGLRIYEVKEVPVNVPALQALVRSAEYRIAAIDDFDLDDLQARIDKTLAAESIMRTKKSKKNKQKTIDIRPMIHELYLDSGKMIAHLACGQEHGNLRPNDLLEVMDLADVAMRIHRFRLHIDDYQV